ncbi:MAG: presenilin family intramembrane aspartyl protease [Candidatus ainarchaeum sp.]|nr:presenilin family intramembrane aspartyl protease [Candidatus ainarchaeum sp.]MDD3975698.1 presenilin family intramembrane aspartyl protease [Candidatus ainarchaeum sp.]
MTKKLDFNFFIIFILIFVFIQIIGLISANYYLNQDAVRGVFTEDPNNVINAFGILIEILIFTFLMIFLKRFFKKQNYLNFFEIMALFVGCVVVFDVFLSYYFALLISLFLLVFRNFLKFKKNIKLLMWYNNFLLAISIAGAGSIIGLSLGVIPVIVFIILLSIYDIIAVFYTKHMVVLANMVIKKKLAFTFSIPTKRKVYQLGGGDIVIPLLTSVSFFYILIGKYTFIQTIFPIMFIWLASILGLVLTFVILSKSKKIKALPALPLQTLFMLFVIIYILIFLL